jgi:flagellar protein FliO/FliZ
MLKRGLTPAKVAGQNFPRLNPRLRLIAINHSMDVINLLHYLLALVFVLALVSAALLVKRFGNNPAAFKASLGVKLGKWDFNAPERRLAVLETLVLGPKQRVLIIRRDNVEHLILIGPEGSSLIESNIADKVSAK